MKSFKCKSNTMIQLSTEFFPKGKFFWEVQSCWESGLFGRAPVINTFMLLSSWVSLMHDQPDCSCVIKNYWLKPICIIFFYFLFVYVFVFCFNFCGGGKVLFFLPWIWRISGHLGTNNGIAVLRLQCDVHLKSVNVLVNMYSNLGHKFSLYEYCL